LTGWALDKDTEEAILVGSCAHNGLASPWFRTEGPAPSFTYSAFFSPIYFFSWVTVIFNEFSDFLHA